MSSFILRATNGQVWGRLTTGLPGYALRLPGPEIEPTVFTDAEAATKVAQRVGARAHIQVKVEKV